MSGQFIVIRHTDGREYAVLPDHFHRVYEAQGFVAVAYESGTEYVAPVKDETATTETKKAAK